MKNVLFKSLVNKFTNFNYEPRTKIKKHHTLMRLLNFIISRLQLLIRSSYVLSYPYFLVIESTNICNLKCPLCPTGQGINGRAKGRMSFLNFKKIIDEVGKYLYSVRLENWGEPLLNEDIFDMVAYAKAKKINTSFNTNIYFLDAVNARKLVLSGLDHIKISLDGVTQESYSQYRRGGNFNKVVDNIKLLIETRNCLNKRNPFIEIQFILMKHNEHEIEQVRQLSHSIGVDGLLIEELRLDMRGELFNPDITGIVKFKDWLPENSKYSLCNSKSRRRKDKSKICNYLWTTSVINWDGSIVPCCSIYDEKYDFGNFYNDGFRKVWNGPRYIASRKLIGKKIENCGTTVCSYCSKYGVIN